MIDDAPVDFFGHAQIEAAIACFHMENRYLAAFGGDGGQTAVGVAQDEHCLGSFRSQHLVNLGNDVSNGFGRAGAALGCVEKMVRLAHP